jgi:demethylmenaquinone methyltransferase/2-methoxy-6-polyprenyl-1,4-benzoquinol methylase
MLLDFYQMGGDLSRKKRRVPRAPGRPASPAPPVRPGAALHAFSRLTERAIVRGMSAERYPRMEELTPTGQTRVVREIFTTGHERYDLLNHLLSFRRDIGWRAATVKKMRFARTMKFLDVATGTADLAIAAAHQYPHIRVTGLDFAAPMLDIGRRKVTAEGLEERVSLVEGDALSLPFPDGSFDVAAVAFGMRNMPDRRRALGEMARVTVPGGQVMILEMTFAPAPVFRPLYGFYLSRILPGIARLFKGNPATYHYLADSIRHLPSPQDLGVLMTETGLQDVTFTSLTFGVAYLHIGRAPGGA